MILTLIFCASCAARADIFSGKKENFSLSVTPLAGFSKSLIKETLFRSAPDENTRISLLQWNKSAPAYGLSLEADIKNAGIKFSVFSNCPFFSSGTMDDSDWDNSADFSMKTIYSVGETEIQRSGGYSAFFSYSFKKRNFVFSPAAGVSLAKDTFVRKTAEGWYGTKDHTSDGRYHWWYDEESKKYPHYNENTGKTQKLAEIDFDRNCFRAELGFSSDFIVSKNAALSFSVFTAAFSYNSAVDTHWKQDASTKELYPMRYKFEYTSFFEKFTFKAGFRLDISKDFSVQAGFSKSVFLHAKKSDMKGTFTSDLDKFYSSGQDFTLEEDSFSASLGVKIKII